MGFIKNIFGLALKETGDGAYSPSKLALKLATSDITDYEEIKIDKKYTGDKKILMVCTEEKNMTMANGKKFSTGNHPVEMLVPMLHLYNAGFDIDIATPTGQPVQIEMWAFPNKDENVGNIYKKYKSKFEKPINLNKFVNEELEENKYLAVFVPGGHGAMLGLPENKDFAKILHYFNDNNLHTLAICHAPAALLAANLDKSKPFIYKGYKMAAFPDSADKQSPMVGYMPGHMPWIFGEKLEKLGVEIINKKADKTCYVDRKLVTGASPKSANEFGKLCVKELLKENV